jgi:hypothetical protein
VGEKILKVGDFRRYARSKYYRESNVVGIMSIAAEGRC